MDEVDEKVQVQTGRVERIEYKGVRTTIVPDLPPMALADIAAHLRREATTTGFTTLAVHLVLIKRNEKKMGRYVACVAPGYLFIDGQNIDAQIKRVLGQSQIGHDLDVTFKIKTDASLTNHDIARMVALERHLDA